jgi:hypothetical protein
MRLWQEHVPQPKLLRLLLEVLDDLRVGGETLLNGFANLAEVDGVGGYTFFFDELFDLERIMSVGVGCQKEVKQGKRTISNVFAARSLSHGRAITGTRWLAVRWPLCEFTRSSDMVTVFVSLLNRRYQ